jgi:hypothetical protein
MPMRGGFGGDQMHVPSSRRVIMPTLGAGGSGRARLAAADVLALADAVGAAASGRIAGGLWLIVTSLLLLLHAGSTAAVTRNGAASRRDCFCIRRY